MMMRNDEDVDIPENEDGMDGAEPEAPEAPEATPAVPVTVDNAEVLSLVKLLHGRGPKKRRDNELLEQLTTLLG